MASNINGDGWIRGGKFPSRWGEGMKSDVKAVRSGCTKQSNQSDVVRGRKLVNHNKRRSRQFERDKETEPQIASW